LARRAVGAAENIVVVDITVGPPSMAAYFSSGSRGNIAWLCRDFAPHAARAGHTGPLGGEGPAPPPQPAARGEEGRTGRGCAGEGADAGDSASFDAGLWVTQRHRPFFFLFFWTTRCLDAGGRAQGMKARPRTFLGRAPVRFWRAATAEGRCGRRRTKPDRGATAGPPGGRRGIAWAKAGAAWFVAGGRLFLKKARVPCRRPPAPGSRLTLGAGDRRRGRGPAFQRPIGGRRCVGGGVAVLEGRGRPRLAVVSVS